MKKVFLTVALAAASLAASAQVYVGGEVGFWRNADDNHTNFNIKPEIGYNLSDKWDLGIGIGFNHDYYGTGKYDGETIAKIKVNSFEVDPYARWSFVKFGPVKLFLDMGFGINTYKVKGEIMGHDYDSDAQVGWRVGVQPGVKVSLAKNVDFIAHMGFLGYQESDDSYCAYGEDGFGFNFSGNNLNFGILYNF